MFGYLARRLLLGIRARFGNLPKWSGFHETASYRETHKLDVLIASNVGSYLPGGIIESLVAAHLLARGKSVGVVLCDSALPACMACTREWLPSIEKFSHHGPDWLMCRVCQESGRTAFRGLPVQLIKLSDFLTETDREFARESLVGKSIDEMTAMIWNEIPVGEHGRAGAIRYLKSDLTLAEDLAEPLLRRFCEAAVLSVIAYTRILDEFGPTGVLAHHGVYVPQGIVADVTRSRGHRLVTWMPSYRRNTVLFASEDTYHKVMVRPLPTPLPVLTAEQAQDIRRYLAERETGMSDWISFSPKRSVQHGIFDKLQLDPNRPVVTLFTNVSWDAQVHFEDNIFVDMFDWLRSTLTYLLSRFPTIQVIIRVHPGEIVGQLKSEQPVAAVVQSWHDIDLAKVRIVDAGSSISSYALARLSRFAVIYASKIGIELAARGIKVLVGGEAWVKNKGVTVDPSSREAYFEAITELVNGDAQECNIELAESFAYHVFFRAMREIKALTGSNGYPPFRLTGKTVGGELEEDENLDSVIQYLTGAISQL